MPPGRQRFRRMGGRFLILGLPVNLDTIDNLPIPGIQNDKESPEQSSGVLKISP
jgi:hypothetical protein